MYSHRLGVLDDDPYITWHWVELAGSRFDFYTSPAFFSSLARMPQKLSLAASDMSTAAILLCNARSAAAAGSVAHVLQCHNQHYTVCAEHTWCAAKLWPAYGCNEISACL